MTARALRFLLVANDGFSAGHVARMIAIAGALARVAAARERKLQTVLATTSQADPLLDAAEAVVVRLPAPVVARNAGFSDTERRRLVSGTLEGLVRSFAPDVVAIDTFPLGPHRELANLDLGHARRALVRRHVPSAVLADPTLAEGSHLLDLAILTDDGGAFESPLRCRCVNVPPIMNLGARLTKAEARKALNLPEGRVILVAAGGGGDEQATAHATRIAHAIVKLDADCTVALALGPLARSRVESERVVHIEPAPLAPYLAAFDGAIAPAGYNTTHELAGAGVPAVLFAEPRPFDDQAARAARFDATVLRSFDDEAISRALQAMKPLRAIAPNGADLAAEALFSLVGA